MSGHSHKHSPDSPTRKIVRRFFSTVSILCIVLYVIFFGVDLFDYFHNKDKKEEAGGPVDSFSVSMKNSIQDQLDRLQKVDPMGLLGVFDGTLDTKQCNWIFWCHDKPAVGSAYDPVFGALGRKSMPKVGLSNIEKADAILARNSVQHLSADAQAGSPLWIPNDSAPGSLRGESDIAISAKLRAHPSGLPTGLMSLQPGGVPIPNQSAGITPSLTKGTDPPPLGLPINSLPSTTLPSSAVAASRLPDTRVNLLPAPVPIRNVQGTLPHIVAQSPHQAPTPMTFFSHFRRFGPIFVPTWDTVRVTPYALLQMAVAIRKQGARAVTMYLSCTVIFAFFWFRAVDANKSGYGIYTAAVLSPLCISLMVMCVQLVAELLLKTCGWAVGLLAIIVAHATALALLVGVRHIVKTPRELIEEVEKLV